MDTDISVIIDMSGSMAGRTADTIGGFNTWLKETAKGQVQGDDVRISIVVFDDVCEQHVTNVPLRSCPKLGTPKNPYRPRGSTALLDAVGKTLSAAKKRVPKGKRGIALVITDGMENASREWLRADVAKLLAGLERSKRWSIVYLGQGIDAWAQGQFLYAGTQSAQATSYDPRHTRQAYAANAAVTSAFMASAQGASASLGGETQALLDEDIKNEQKVKTS